MGVTPIQEALEHPLGSLAPASADTSRTSSSLVMSSSQDMCTLRRPSLVSMAMSLLEKKRYAARFGIEPRPIASADNDFDVHAVGL